MPEFSRKNSRFSGKNRLNRVRLTCCSSASACAKSGLTVTSSVSDGVTPYFASSSDVRGRVVCRCRRARVALAPTHGFSSQVAALARIRQTAERPPSPARYRL